MNTPGRRLPVPAPGGRELVEQFLDRGLVVKLIGALLLFTLLPLAEILLFIYLGHLIGNFLVLVLVVILGAAGALVAVDQARRSFARLEGRLETGRYPAAELVDLLGVIAGGILLVTPGFLTDACGYALMVPGVRRAAGTLAEKVLGPRVTNVLGRLASFQSLKTRYPSRSTT
jgi:UPF0716 protein FxsA